MLVLPQPLQMIAENRRKEAERQAKQALAGLGNMSALESVDELPISVTYSKLEKSLPADGKVPWAEFFK